MSDRLRVGVIGVGRIGGPMADRVIDAGFETSIFDVAPDAVRARSDRGARAAVSPADAARDVDVLSLVVFDGRQAIEVLTGSDGALTTLPAGAVVAVHTTVSAVELRQLADAARETRVRILDAGVTGGEDGAREGRLITMVGGESDAVTRATPVFDAFSRLVIHAGPLGSGMALKLARNAVGYSWMTAVHESMALAQAAEVDLAQLQYVLREAGVFDQALSPFLLGGPAPLTGTEPDGLRTMLQHLRDLGEKDLDGAIDLARELGVEIPVFSETRVAFSAVTRATDG